MAGLFDLLSMQGQPGGGLLGNVGGWLGNNQDALVAMGLGMAGGATPMEGFKGGMQGYLSGRKSDQSRTAGEAFIKDMGLGVAPSAGPFSKPSPALGPAGMPPQGGQPNFGNAIAGIESGGKYDALGPVTKTGDRAYGKYQVMGANIPQWTQTHLGQAMTPEQFIANPQAQDAVFKAQFGQYAQQYGPEGAARAWFAGPGNMNNMGAKDQLGTTVGGYGQKFAQAAGLGPAGAGPAPMQPQPQAPMQPPQAQGGGVQPVPQDQLGAIRRLPIETVMKWAMNPNLPENMQGVAKEIFKARLEDTKMTEAQKDYLIARMGPDGYKGSFAQWKNQPSFGDTGQRDEFDRPIQGWRDPTQAVGSQPAGAGQPKAPIELVTKLRNEVHGQQSYKRLAVAMPVYNSLVDAAGRDDRGSDLNLIYGFATIMDPDSVVRGEEMTMVKAIATLPDKLKSEVMSQMNETGRLSPTVRASLMREANSRVTSYKGTYDQLVGKQYGGLADRYRMNRADVLPDFGDIRKYEPPAAAAAPVRVQSPEDARKLPSGTPIILPDGSPGKVP
jgi:hypothetical protein